MSCIHAVMGQVFNDYVESQNGNMKEEYLITSTVGYALPPKKLSELKPGNFWYPCVMPITLT